MEWLNFNEGMAVEVKFDEDCQNDDWFPANIRRKVEGVNSFLVKYNKSSNKGKDGLTEAVVDSSHIRPPPPNLKVENFKFMEKVDAFYDSAWRLGVVTKVLTGGRYSVFLKNGKHGKQEKELSHSEIRPHMDFMNGVWVNASQSTQSCASGQALMGHVNSNAKIPKDTNQENLAAGNSVKMWKTPAKLPVKTQLSLKAENEKDNNKGYSAAHIAGVENIVNEVDSSVVLASGMGSLPSENSCWIFDKESIQQENVENEMIISLEELGISSHPQVKSQSVLPGEYNVTGVNVSNMGIEDSATEEVKSAAVTGVQPGEVTEVHASDMGIKDGATEEDKSPAGTGVELGVQGAVTETSPLVSSTDDPAKEVNEAAGRTSCSISKNKYNVTGVDVSDMGIKDGATEVVKSPAGIGVHLGGMMVPGASTETSPFISSTNYLAKQVNEAVARSSCSTSNNVKPQSLCFEGNSSDEAMKQWNDTSKIERGTIKQDGVINASLANENQEMPFVKNSAIWEVVESQEVFQIMPQKPHFHPLVKHKELQREAFAIGYMVTFATLADKVCQLEVNSPRNVFDSYLETLDDLKTLGFKVEPVEDRINKLLLIKGKRVKLEEQSKEVEVHLAERRNERTKLEEDISAIDEELRKLEEKRALAISAKERKDSKLNSLRTESGAVGVDISKARSDFEMLASASW